MHQFVMVPLVPSVKSGTLQSDLNIPDERDRCYGPMPPKHSDDDDVFVM